MAFQTGYTSTLALPVGASDTTITVAVAPVATSGRMKIGRGTLRERISYSGVSGNVLTGVVRGLSQTAVPATAGVGQTWLAGTTIKQVLMHDQIADVNNGSFTNLNVTNTLTAENLVVNDTMTIPTYADATARDAAIPSPTDGMLVVVAGDLQHYNGITMQRETADTGTPTPNASTTVAGKVQQAVQADIDNNEDTGTTGAPLFVTPTLVRQIQTNIENILNEGFGNLTEETFMLGESAALGSSMFVEDMVTFAASTNVQNIGDTTANTRVQIVALGAGVSATTMKLSLKKFVSPSVPLTIRIETDLNGNPSGTLLNVNSTTTIASASLTTSLADTTITFPGAFTVPLGQKVHIVLLAGTYGSETINATNYYGVGYATQDTTTRGFQSFNGTVWGGTVNGADIADSDGGRSYNSTTSLSTAWGLKMTANAGIYIKSITKSASCTATRAMLISVYGGTILDSATFVGNVATLTTPYFLAQGAEIRVEADANGALYTRHANTGNYPGYTGTNVTFLGGGSAAQGSDVNYIANITAITTATVVFPSTNMPYVSSSLFTQLLLSKTDADFTYKLPNYSKVRIINTTSNVGSVPNVVYYGDYDGYTGMTPNVDMYISNTPGMLSALAGTNPFLVGKTITATKILIGGKLYTYKAAFTTINSSQSSTGTNTSSTYFATQNELISYQISASSAGGASSGTCTLQYSLDGSTNRTTVYQIAELLTGVSTTRTMVSYLKAGVYYRSTSVCTVSATAGLTVLTSTLLSL